MTKSDEAPDAASPPDVHSDTRPLLDVRSAAKSFGATAALKDASLTVRPGEVLALVGENGSGKSTLMKILSGVHRPDRGAVVTRGGSFPGFRSPREAADQGIAAVFQEVLVIEARSVLENIWVGMDGVARSVKKAERRARASAVLEALLGRPLDLDALVEDLSLPVQQACSIARALIRDPDVLVLDESTSALDLATRDRLFDIVRTRCRAGKGAVFISHRMDEITAIADRVTVMRSGETVATLAIEDAGTEELVRLMTGHESLVPAEVSRRPAPGEVIARVAGLDLRAGEIVGLGGLEGQGQEEFLRSLTSLPGTVYVPRDRRAEGIFPHMSILENFALPTLARDTQLGIIRRSRSRGRLQRYIRELGITLRSERDPITSLSGGNQQKVVIARWLAAGPQILLLNDPTRGIDIGAKRDIYAVLEALVAQGAAIVMLSTELDELIELMDRLLIFHDGRRVELGPDHLDRESIVAAYFAGDAAHV